MNVKKSELLENLRISERRNDELRAELDRLLAELHDTKCELEESDGMFREICARGNMNRQRADKLEHENERLRKALQEIEDVALTGSIPHQIARAILASPLPNPQETER